MRLQYEILVDRHENPRKCTIQPLEGRPDFTLRRFGTQGPIEPLTASMLLAVDGIPMDQLVRTEPTVVAATRTIAAIDCHWRRCPGILERMARPLPRPVGIPAGFLTAYPRKNAEGKDPEGGLATIEALFIAAAFLGTWDASLFERYHFGDAFLALNRDVFARYGVTVP